MPSFYLDITKNTIHTERCKYILDPFSFKKIGIFTCAKKAKEYLENLEIAATTCDHCSSYTATQFNSNK